MSIIYNAIQTPDGTILVSRHRHDYHHHLDANGKSYFIDGGYDYIRRSANGDETSLTITDESPHEVIREYLEWGTYGITGTDPLTYIKLKDMDCSHIQTILREYSNLSPTRRTAFINELAYREPPCL